MNKKHFKYILIILSVFIASFLGISSLNAETVTIGTTKNDIIYAEKNLIGNYVLYVYGNAARGSAETRNHYQQILKTVCEEGKWNTIIKDGDNTYKCNFNDIRPEFSINIASDGRPVSIIVQSEQFINYSSFPAFCVNVDGVNKFVSKDSCEHICKQDCSSINAGTTSFNTCSVVNIKDNLWLSYNGFANSVNPVSDKYSWKELQNIIETREENNKKYYRAPSSNYNKCITFSEEEVLKANEGTEKTNNSENNGNFFDDWDDIPAAINGFTDLVGGKIDCEGSLGTALKYVQGAFTLIRIGAVVLLIVLSAIDFMGAVAKSDNDALQGATKKMSKRLIITVVIIILPTIINLILKLTLISEGTCGIS